MYSQSTDSLRLPRQHRCRGLAVVAMDDSRLNNGCSQSLQAAQRTPVFTGNSVGQRARVTDLLADSLGSISLASRHQALIFGSVGTEAQEHDHDIFATADNVRIRPTSTDIWTIVKTSTSGVAPEWGCLAHQRDSIAWIESHSG